MLGRTTDCSVCDKCSVLPGPGWTEDPGELRAGGRWCGTNTVCKGRRPLHILRDSPAGGSQSLFRSLLRRALSLRAWPTYRRLGARGMFYTGRRSSRPRARTNPSPWSYTKPKSRVSGHTPAIFLATHPSLFTKACNLSKCKSPPPRRAPGTSETPLATSPPQMYLLSLEQQDCLTHSPFSNFLQ